MRAMRVGHRARGCMHWPMGAALMMVHLASAAAAGGESVSEASERRARGPSFDCAAASGRAQQSVCTDPRLAQLDRELARLFALARAGAHLSTDRRQELVSIQRGWVRARDDCWKAEDLRQCVLDSYVSRIYEVRQGYANARSDDASGISHGPTAMHCDGVDALVGKATIDGHPPALYLQWRNRGVTLQAVQGEADSRYAGRAFDGDYVFVDQGSEARFQRPGKAAVTCSDEPIG